MVQILIEKNGQLWDTKLKVYIPNPDVVREQRNAISRGYTAENQKLTELLGLKTGRFVTTEVNLEYLLGEFDWQGATAESKYKVAEALESILTGLDNKELPEYSIFLRLGNYTRVNELAYAILARAYAQGYKVGPFRYSRELSRLQDYEELLEQDLLVLIVSPEPTSTQLDSVATVMQMRDGLGKPTICIASKHGPIKPYRILFNLDAQDYRYDLCYLVTIEYDKGLEVNQRIATGLDYDFSQARQAQAALQEAQAANLDTTNQEKELSQVFSQDFINIQEQHINKAGDSLVF